MPGRFRSYRKRRPTMYRKKKGIRKTYRKKRMIKRPSKYNPIHHVEINAQKVMTRGTYTQGDTNYQDRFSVYWGLHAGGGTTNQITLADSEEFNFWKQVYNQYRVNGVKIQFRPDKVVGGGDQREWKDMHVASFQDDVEYNRLNISPANMKQMPDYFTTSFKQFNKYVGVSKYQKRINLQSFVKVNEDFSDGHTSVIGRDFNFTNGSEIGMFQVTYYCSFKQPKVQFVE